MNLSTGYIIQEAQVQLANIICHIWKLWLISIHQETILFKAGILSKLKVMEKLHYITIIISLIYSYIQFLVNIPIFQYFYFIIITLPPLK